MPNGRIHTYLWDSFFLYLMYGVWWKFVEKQCVGGWCLEEESIRILRSTESQCHKNYLKREIGKTVYWWFFSAVRGSDLYQLSIDEAILNL